MTNAVDPTAPNTQQQTHRPRNYGPMIFGALVVISAGILIGIGCSKLGGGENSTASTNQGHATDNISVENDTQPDPSSVPPGITPPAPKTKGPALVDKKNGKRVGVMAPDRKEPVTPRDLGDTKILPRSSIGGSGSTVITAENVLIGGGDNSENVYQLTLLLRHDTNVVQLSARKTALTPKIKTFPVALDKPIETIEVGPGEKIRITWKPTTNIQPMCEPSRLIETVEFRPKVGIWDMEIIATNKTKVCIWAQPPKP